MSKILSKNKLNIILIVIFLIFTSNYFLSSSNSNRSTADNVVQSSCSDNIGNINKNDEVLKKDIYVIPEIGNIFCLGKVVDIENNIDGSRTLFIGSNPKIISTLKITILFFMLIMLLLKENFFKIVFLLSLSSYLFLHLIESPGMNFFQYLYSDRLYLFLFMLFLCIIKKNINLLLFSFLYFLFIDYNYFGLYILIIFLFNGLKFQILPKHTFIMKLIAFIFLSSRYLYGYSESLFENWARLSQVNYMVPVRFWDIQWFLSKLSCNSDSSLLYKYKYSDIYFECPTNYSYGPLSEIVKLDSDIWNISLLFTLILFLILFIFYLKLITLFRNESLIITIFLLSPPMNFLLDRTNIDLLIMIGSIFLFLKEDTYNNFKIFILFLFSALKLHPIGAIAGLWLYSVIHKLKNLFRASSIGLGAFILLYLYTLFNYDSRTINPAKREDLSYGFLSDSNYLSNILEVNNSLIYFAMLGFFTFCIIIKIRKLLPSKSEVLKNYQSLYFCFVVWFILTTLYENYAYRYPIFYILFFLVFIEGNRPVQLSILGMICLLPLPVTNEVVQIIIFCLHRLCHYYFLIYICSNLIVKVISNVEGIQLKKLSST